MLEARTPQLGGSTICEISRNLGSALEPDLNSAEDKENSTEVLGEFISIISKKNMEGYNTLFEIKLSLDLCEGNLTQIFHQKRSVGKISFSCIVDASLFIATGMYP